MKDIFNGRQRFSFAQVIVWVSCSVLLGTALFVAGAPSASAEEVTATPESSTETAATETASSTEVATETTTTESSNYEAPAALVSNFWSQLRRLPVKRLRQLPKHRKLLKKKRRQKKHQKKKEN